MQAFLHRSRQYRRIWVSILPRCLCSCHVDTAKVRCLPLYRIQSRPALPLWLQSSWRYQNALSTAVTLLPSSSRHLQCAFTTNFIWSKLSILLPGTGHGALPEKRFDQIDGRVQKHRRDTRRIQGESREAARAPSVGPA